MVQQALKQMSFFFHIFFKEDQVRAARKRVDSNKLPTYHSGGWGLCCTGRMIKSYLSRMKRRAAPGSALLNVKWPFSQSQRSLIKTQSNEILSQ